MKTHISVMLNNLIKQLDLIQDRVYIDSTFGLGGHSIEILKYLDNCGKLYAFEKDLNFYKKHKNIKIKISNISFENFLFDNLGFFYNGILVDLGLSLNQIFCIKKGFGFNFNSFLDMRLDSYNSFRFIDWINFAKPNDLLNVFVFFYNISFVKYFVSKLVFYRKLFSIKTSGDLFYIFSKILGHKDAKITLYKFFQFVRYFINNDFYILNFYLNKCLSQLVSGGILVLLTFNSLEDFFIKNFFIKNSHYILKSFFFKPNICEINKNFSSRSSTMRIFIKK